MLSYVGEFCAERTHIWQQNGKTGTVEIVMYMYIQGDCVICIAQVLLKENKVVRYIDDGNENTFNSYM